MILFIVFFFSAILLLCLFFKRKYSHWLRLGAPQPANSFKYDFGVLSKQYSVSEMIKDIYLEAAQNRYYGMYIFTSPFLLIKDLDLVKKMTVKDFDHFQDHQNIVLESGEPLWAKNLFALKGQSWKEMRATLSPSFTSGKMRTMFILVEETAQNFVQYFKDREDEELNCLELKDAFSRYATDVIFSVAFGVKCDSLHEKNNEFYKMGKRVNSFTRGFLNIVKFLIILAVPAVKSVLKISIFGEEVSQFFRNLIKETIATREKNNIVRPDMLHLLMEARKHGIKYEENKDVIDAGFATVEESEIGKSDKVMKHSLTDDDITAQALIFFIAGFDTASSLMCFMGYELALNPDIQAKLATEIDETWESCNGKLTYEVLLKMKYLDMVISETLRKWPPAPVSDRIVTKSYTIEPTKPGEEPFHIKKDTLILLPIVGIHYDPDYFPNPDKFDPERFNEENKNNINPYSYIPFGAGPRNCIGSRFALLEVKAIFFHLLREFEIGVNERTEIPIKLAPSFGNLDSKNGFWLSFNRRNKSS